MTAENIITTVDEVAKQMGISAKQYKPLQRFFLHKMTSLSLDEIALITCSCKRAVYKSIEKIDSNKRLDNVKAKIIHEIS